MTLLALAFLALVVTAMNDLGRISHGFAELKAIIRLFLNALVFLVALVTARSAWGGRNRGRGV